ncbi:unnamed protein product [Camellia sinensis]
MSGLSGGVIARISIAGVVGVLLLAVCIYVGVYKKKKVQDKILLLQDLNINQFKLQGEIARPSNLSATPVHLNIQDDHVVIDNGILQLTLSNPGGTVTGITYGGIDNLIELHNQELNGGRIFGVSTLEATAHDDFRKLASAIYLQVRLRKINIYKNSSSVGFLKGRKFDIKKTKHIGLRCFNGGKTLVLTLSWRIDFRCVGRGYQKQVCRKGIVPDYDLRQRLHRV